MCGTSACVESVAMTSVCPSGVARAAWSMPMMPLAPGRLSTITGEPRLRLSFSAT